MYTLLPLTNIIYIKLKSFYSAIIIQSYILIILDIFFLINYIKTLPFYNSTINCLREIKKYI